MDELLTLRAWAESLDFSGWEVGGERDSIDAEDEPLRWLAARDAPAFSAGWMRVLGLVESQEHGASPGERESAVIVEIRQIGLFKARKAALATELADYAADDFDLLARAARVGMVDFWLQKLRAEYEAGRFPHGSF